LTGKNEKRREDKKQPEVEFFSGTVLIKNAEKFAPRNFYFPETLILTVGFFKQKASFKISVCTKSSIIVFQGWICM
jgi:hypothetical protein